MGTRGLYGYRYRGKYYCRYNHWDSYLEGLGKKLVACIPTDLKAFQRWLENARKFISTFEGQEGGSNGDEVDLDNDQYFNGLHGDFEYSSDPPDFYHWDAEWMYIYDLDNVAFTIRDFESTIHLRLDNIPRGGDNMAWIKLIYSDTLEHLCRSPYALDEHFAEVDRAKSPSANFEDVQLFQETRIDSIDPTSWMNAPVDDHLSMLQKLAVISAEGIIGALYSMFSNVQEQDGGGVPDSLLMELLTSAAPAGSTFSFDIPKEDTTSQVKKRNTPGRMFWFRGRLIVLANRLDIEGVYESYVGMAIRRVQELGLEECTVILWSAFHIAVVVISGEKVSCSEAIPFVAAFCKDDEQFEQALCLIAHYLPPPWSEGSPQFSSRLPLELFVRIMDFTDPDSTFMLGRTSKALRLEWLKRPAIGHYTLLSDLGDGGFIVRNSKKDNKVIKISIKPPETLPFDEWDGHAGFGIHTAFTKDDGPFQLINRCYRKAYFYPGCGDIDYQVASLPEY